MRKRIRLRSVFGIWGILSRLNRRIFLERGWGEGVSVLEHFFAADLFDLGEVFGAVEGQPVGSVISFGLIGTV